MGSRLDSVNRRGEGDSLEHKGAMEGMTCRDRSGRDGPGQTGSTRSRPGLDGANPSGTGQTNPAETSELGQTTKAVKADWVGAD